MRASNCVGFRQNPFCREVHEGCLPRDKKHYSFQLELDVERPQRNTVGCCQAHRGLPVGFPLLRYSVLFTVESLSLLYLLFTS